MKKIEAGWRLRKENAATSVWRPLERAVVDRAPAGAAAVSLTDGAGREYARAPVRRGRAELTVRGAAGAQRLRILDAAGRALGEAALTVRAETRFACDRGPYAALAERIARMLIRDEEHRTLVIRGRLHRMLVTWGRDHVHTLKAQKYLMADVQSGMDYWLDTQEPNGMFWDCIHHNSQAPARTWFGEALGRGYFRYEDNRAFIVRRIPVEADCEFLYTEGVWHAWKASGDDAWMARQLPRLEKALRYNASHPARWSRKHGLVRRSMCMDSWDFVNPHYCRGDHRAINPGDPQFLFHGDNSGLYSSYGRLAEMYEHLGGAARLRRARELRREGEALRRRANARLFFGNTYGHMIPERRPEREVYARVGDERRRMSLSLGYTINRRLPTHAMAVKILKEYRRRGRQHRDSSFAEWWTMDPPYTREQWPLKSTGGSQPGDYMNGGICPIVAGELARAAFEHGLEDYGVDILERVWALSERDGGGLHQVYRRLPERVPPPAARFAFVDLRTVVNRGLRHRAHPGVEAWTGEGVNDLRGLPTGRQRFGAIEFDVIDPAANGGRAVLRVQPAAKDAPSAVTIPVPSLKGRGLYFLHATAGGSPAHAVVAQYEVCYADGAVERIPIRQAHEIGHWWGPSEQVDPRRPGDALDRGRTRVAWRGANGEWADVGLYMTGLDNPRPETAVTAIRIEALPAAPKGVMVAGISLSDSPVTFETRIRSHGLPDCWARAAVYYAIAEGLAGIEDRGRAFSKAAISPRWAATPCREADATLHYPASGGYCAYRYRRETARRMALDIAGSFETATVHALLPRGFRPRRVEVDGRDVPFKVTRVEGSSYADFALRAPPSGPVVIRG